MKRYLIPIIVILVLALGLCGCQTTGTTKPAPTKADVATLTQDEVCALVYNYLENKIASVSVVPLRLSLLDALGKARPYFQAVYQGNGKWQVRALGGGSLGSGGRLASYNYDGLWNLYEASGVIEPANSEASELLQFIHRWTQ